MAKGGVKAAAAGGGKTGMETILGTSLDDELIAAAGRQKIDGGDGNDLLDGGDGDDILKGGAGDDILIGGMGADMLWGGSGADTFVYNSLAEGGDSLKDFEPGVDKIDLSALGLTAEDVAVAQSGSNLVLTVNGETFLTLNDFSILDWNADDLILGQPEPVVIAATYDNENIFLGPTFGPADGVDEITADGHTNVAIMGTSGDDYLDFSATTLTGIVNISGEGGNDTIIGSAGDDTITGADGNDILNGGAGNDIMNGVLGADTYVVGLNSGTDTFNDSGNDGSWDKVIAEADGVTIEMNLYFSFLQGIEEFSADGHTGVTISGTEGDDILWFFGGTQLNGIESIDGQGGNDNIWGSDWNDTISGGAGADSLNGGAGADSFVYGAYANGEGGDVIYDFNNAEGDTLDLSALIASVEVDSYTLVSDGTNTTVQLNMADGTFEDYITVQGTNITDGDVII